MSLFVDAADAFERERDAPPVLAHAGQSVAAALRDEDEAAAAATDADDATGHDLTVEPAHEGLCARVRRAFQEARARARQALQPARDFRGQVAVAFGELRTQAPLGLGARPFEAREFFGGVAAREAPLGDVAHLREGAVGVEQVEERGVGRAELTLQRVGRRVQE